MADVRRVHLQPYRLQLRANNHGNRKTKQENTQKTAMNHYLSKVTEGLEGEGSLAQPALDSLD